MSRIYFNKKIDLDPSWTQKDECVGADCSCRSIGKKCAVCHTIKPLCCFPTKGVKRNQNGNFRYRRHCADCAKEMRRWYQLTQVAECLDPREGEISGFVFDDDQDVPVGEIVQGADGVPAVRPYARLSRAQKGGK